MNSATIARLGRTLPPKAAAAALVGVACLLTLVGLAGWVFANDRLKTFGATGFPIRPWTAVGYLFLSAAAFASLLERRRIAGVLTVVPAAIALWTVLRRIGWIQVELYRPFFPNQLAASDIPHAALPTIGASISFLLLTSAILAMPRRSRRLDDASVLLAGSALLIGLASCVMVLLVSPEDGASVALVSSLPASLAGIAIAAALILPRHRAGWEILLSAGDEEWRSFRRVLPVILILPVAPSLLEFWIERNDLLPSGAGRIAVITGNVLIVAVLIAWAMARVLRQQGELFYLNRAIDTANIALTTTDGVITHWSGGCEFLYGYSSRAAIGRRKYELLQSRPARGGDLLLAASENEQELVELCRDGTEISVIERQQRVEIPGRAPMIVLNLLDITERVSAEAALRTSEERLALATEAHEVGVFEWNVASGALTWSPGAEQRLGLEAGSVRDYESWKAMIVPEDAEAIVETIGKAVAAKADKFSFSYRFLPINGISRSIEGSSRCIYDPTGNLIRTVGVCLDTTERDGREAALRASEAQLRSIIETVPEAMVVIDENGTVHGFSNAAERTWGYRAEEVLGRNFAMLATEEEGKRYATALRNYIATGQTTAIGRDVPGTGLTKSGLVFPAEIQVGVARSGDELRIAMFFTDISERLVAEERMSDLNHELAHLARQSAMSELAADMAHELNQPLTAVSNLLATARILTERGDDPARAVDLLRMGGEQTIRAGEIVRRMRDFVARREVAMRPESLDRLVNDAIELVMVGTRPFDIGLTIDFDPAADRIFADGVQVQQVVVNLLRNALEALRDRSRPDRRIWIRSRRLDGPLVEVELSDNGPGISVDMLDKLYTRFSTSKTETGMGIGLSISRRIVEAHGGTLTAGNQPEGGASFRFTLPADEGLPGE
ncbi:MAG: sensor histidine kinase [Sphingomonas bacterium]|uniref:PAS domain S-box protein n=1 Tax=Sphingomonas bacterium TaxID=1895847 RepID=UPI00261BAE72|nr:PAS domain S-box protein [Sphingomonas bacterium]MDB5707568.1 sensor histidine kinase [Sphingomonas bacterium]